LKHPSLPKVVDFCSGFLGSIPDISELSILLVSRGTTPGIHGRELLRREMRDGKRKAAARPHQASRLLSYSNVEEPLRRHCEERKRRSNPDLIRGNGLDCFHLRSSSYGGHVAPLAMTMRIQFRILAT
jgi:hypothetical protein